MRDGFQMIRPNAGAVTTGVIQLKFWGHPANAKGVYQAMGIVRLACNLKPAIEAIFLRATAKFSCPNPAALLKRNIIEECGSLVCGKLGEHRKASLSGVMRPEVLCLAGASLYREGLP